MGVLFSSLKSVGTVTCHLGKAEQEQPGILQLGGVMLLMLTMSS